MVSFVLLASFAVLTAKMFSRPLQFSPLKEVVNPLGQEAHLSVYPTASSLLSGLL